MKFVLFLGHIEVYLLVTENNRVNDEGRLIIDETITPADAGELSAAVGRVARLVEDEWRQAGFEAPDLRVRMILDEAALNAWIHGNREDPAKSITIRCRMGKDCVLEVVDQGAGFDYEDIPDPTEAENVSKPHGRGIFIMRYFANEVDWEDGGRRLVVRAGRNFDKVS